MDEEKLPEGSVNEEVDEHDSGEGSESEKISDYITEEKARFNVPHPSRQLPILIHCRRYWKKS